MGSCATWVCLMLTQWKHCPEPHLFRTYLPFKVTSGCTYGGLNRRWHRGSEPHHQQWLHLQLNQHIRFPVMRNETGTALRMATAVRKLRERKLHAVTAGAVSSPLLVISEITELLTPTLFWVLYIRCHLIPPTAPMGWLSDCRFKGKGNEKKLSPLIL